MICENIKTRRLVDLMRTQKDAIAFTDDLSIFVDHTKIHQVHLISHRIFVTDTIRKQKAKCDSNNLLIL